MATCIAPFIQPLTTDWPGTWVQVVACIWLTAAFVADITITVTLVWDLVNSLPLVLCVDSPITITDITLPRCIEEEDDRTPLH